MIVVIYVGGPWDKDVQVFHHNHEPLWSDAYIGGGKYVVHEKRIFAHSDNVAATFEWVPEVDAEEVADFLDNHLMLGMHDDTYPPLRLCA